MTAETETGMSASPSKAAVWTGWILTGLIVLANLMGVWMNLSGNAQAVEGAVKMGYPETSLFGIGIALLISTAVYALPQTSVVGAILLTGYMGGAVATHIRAGEGWLATIPAFVFAALVWSALLLRNRRLRKLLPLVRK
jgi:hypothetical protein